MIIYIGVPFRAQNLGLGWLRARLHLRLLEHRYLHTVTCARVQVDMSISRGRADNFPNMICYIKMLDKKT